MYLLDTNAFLILLFNDLAQGKLRKQTMEILLTETDLSVSVASLQEMAIKVKINKLNLGVSIGEVEQECYRQGITILPIKSSYLDKTIELPLMSDHGDPFDRIIMATSLIENMTLISTDYKVRRKEYGVKVIW